MAVDAMLFLCNKVLVLIGLNNIHYSNMFTQYE